MSVVYWGIVAGLVALIAVFFVCMNLLYADAKGPRPQSNRSMEQPSEPTREPSVRNRYAA